MTCAGGVGHGHAVLRLRVHRRERGADAAGVGRRAGAHTGGVLSAVLIQGTICTRMHGSRAEPTSKLVDVKMVKSWNPGPVDESS